MPGTRPGGDNGSLVAGLAVCSNPASQPPSSVTLGKSLPFSLSLIPYLKREAITIVLAPYGESVEGQINELRQGSNRCQLVFLCNSLFLTFKTSSSLGASLGY